MLCKTSLCHATLTRDFMYELIQWIVFIRITFRTASWISITCLAYTISPRARGHLIAKFDHCSGVYHLKEHRLGFQKMKLLSVYVGG